MINLTQKEINNLLGISLRKLKTTPTQPNQAYNTLLKDLGINTLSQSKKKIKHKGA